MKKEENFNQEFEPYKVDKLSKIPSWVVILILKFWAAAAAIFFIGIGGVTILNFSELQTDDVYENLAQSFSLIILFGLFLAIFTNYVVRPYVRLMHNRRNNAYRYNLINIKGFKSFLFSLLYNLPLSLLLFFVTVFLSMHHLVWDPFGTSGGVGIEPFTYSICYIVIDGIIIIIKNIIYYVYLRLKYKRQIREA